MTQITVVAGEGEYHSERTLRQTADELRNSLGAKVSFCTPDILRDTPDFPESRFAGLEALADSDLMIIFTRWRRLPDEQMEQLDAYLKRGGAVTGFRTSTHAFRFADNSPWASWNSGFGRDVLGTPWTRHHGHSSTTIVRKIPEAAASPLLEGVDEEFRAHSWLYQVELEPGCNLLLDGEPVNPEVDPVSGPLAWTRHHSGGGKVFYTSLGHPRDFTIPSFRALIRNGVSWCLEP